MLAFVDVSAAYGKRAVLHDLDLELDRGLHVVLAPNGAGKTTLFRVGAGVLKPTRGRVLLDGRDLGRDPSVRSSIGYLSHREGFSPRMNVRDGLEFWARVIGLSRRARNERIAGLAEELAIGDLLTRPFAELSRGQRQRVSLARVLLGDPNVLFLDEPTTGIDPIAARAFRKQLLDMTSLGRTIVYTTHNLWEAAELASTIVLLKDGTVYARGTLPELRSLIDAKQTISLTLAGEPATTFLRLGHHATFSKGSWLVEDVEPVQVSNLIRELVSDGVMVSAVGESENSLERVYEELNR